MFCGTLFIHYFGIYIYNMDVNKKEKQHSR